MADEEKGLAEAAEGWTTANPPSAYEDSVWKKLFDPATSGDYLEGYAGSVKCKAIYDYAWPSKLAGSVDDNDDEPPDIAEGSILYAGYKKHMMRVSQTRQGSVTLQVTNDAEERLRYLKAIYSGIALSDRLLDSTANDGGVYGGVHRSCKAIADIAYEHHRATELFNSYVKEPLSAAVKDEGGKALGCAKTIKERAEVLREMLVKFQEESTNPEYAIFTSVASAEHILNLGKRMTVTGPASPRDRLDPLLSKIGFTNQEQLGAPYLKADNLYATWAAVQNATSMVQYGTYFRDAAPGTEGTLELARLQAARMSDINSRVAGIEGTMFEAANSAADHYIIMYDPEYDNAVARAQHLTVPDMIYVDNQQENAGIAYAGNDTQIFFQKPEGSLETERVKKFPYYWSSVLARMFYTAWSVYDKASSKSFSTEGLAMLSSRQNGSTNLDKLFMDNHGNGLMGSVGDKIITDHKDRGRTLYDILNVGALRLSPPNSDIRFIVESYEDWFALLDKAEDMDESARQMRSVDASVDLALEALGDIKNYTLSGWCQQTMDAAKLISSYPWGTTAVSPEQERKFIAVGDYLYIRAADIKKVADELAEASQCILDADEELTEEAWDLETEFKNALGDNEMTLEVEYWFDKTVDDVARDGAIAAQELDIDDLGALDEELAGGSKGKRALFKEQCFLLSYIGFFANYKKNKLDAIGPNGTPAKTGIHKRLPYTDLTEKTQIPLAPGYRDSDEETGPNACVMVDGDPYGFINKLTQSPRYGTLFDIDHWHLSSLQPKIRLFKVVYETGNNDKPIEKEVEMSFNSHFSKDELDLFKGSRSRGAGVGLKSFEFTYDGSNPFAAKKSIKANLKIFASTFHELFVDRQGDCVFANLDDDSKTNTGTETYRFVDLALKTLSKEKSEDQYDPWKAIIDENEKLAKLNFRLKAVVGWTSPDGKMPDDHHSDYSTAALKGALEDSFVTLNLTPTVHNFEFDEQGRVIMNINYLAYVEDFFDQTAYNVYAEPTGHIGFIREKRKLQMKALRSACDYDDSDEQAESDKTLEALEKKYADSVDKEIKDSIKSIVKTMMENDKVLFINVDTDKVSSHTAYGPYINIRDITGIAGGDIVLNAEGYEEDLKATITEALEQPVEGGQSYEAAATAAGDKNLVAAALAATNPKNYYLGYFYISDLVDTVLENIENELLKLGEKFEDLQELEYVEDEELRRRKRNLKQFKDNFKRLRILLGPVEFIEYNRSNGKVQDSSFVNFGDIPVSVKYFVEFLADRSLSKEDSFYSLTSFLNDLFNNLITNFLNNKKCFAFSTTQRVRVNQSTITSYNDTDDSDEITSLILKKAKSIYKSKAGCPARISLNDTVVVEHQKGTNNNGIPRALLNISGRGPVQKYIPITKETNYFTFFAGRVQPVNRMNGDKKEDHENGVFHYLLGRDRGLVKNISLSKTETPGLQEVRFEQEGYEGLEQLRVVYDADIECYSNVNTFPGTYIYIDPKGFDPSLDKTFDITRFGVGGYYMIIKSTHKFAAGEAKSKIYAKWVAQLQTNFPVESVGHITEAGSAYSCKRANDRLERLQNSEDE